MHRGDALVAQQRGEIPDIAEATGFRDDQAGPPGGEHAEQFTDRYVETLGGHLQQPVPPSET